MVFALAIPVAIRIARDTRGRRLSAHALPMMGALAALGVGEWASALLVLLLVRLASMVERDTMRRGRSALLELDALRPAIARVAHGAHEHVVPADRVPLGATVIVRPGDRVPVDGVVTAGEARLTQSAITGTDDLVHVQAGDEVFAASLAHGGALHVRATRVGGETTFGRIVEGVILAESHRPRIAATVDRFAAWYTPLIIAVALVSWAATRSVVAGASVLVIACSCSLVITVPVAMVMSIATAARSGLLVKSGRALELLARSDVLLVDKTGTVTFGEPAIDEIVAFDGTTEHDLIRLAAAAERNAEHPLARAVCRLAESRAIAATPTTRFAAFPGRGVEADVEGETLRVGNEHWVASGRASDAAGADCTGALLDHRPTIAEWHARGMSAIVVRRGNRLIGLLGAADRLRPAVEDALDDVRRLGVATIELITGDHPAAAERLARRLRVACRGGLLPDEKLAIVRDYQARGQVVTMVGDGVNDAPALAQADVGIAMGTTGTAVASDAADIVLLRDDWVLVPDAIGIARRTMRVVRMNLAGSALYNVLAVSLAACGFVQPVLAAAAHSAPDLGVLGNSARLMRPRRRRTSTPPGVAGADRGANMDG